MKPRNSSTCCGRLPRHSSEHPLRQKILNCQLEVGGWFGTKFTARLDPTPVRKSMSVSDSIPKLVQYYNAEDTVIDQSDLSGLLIWGMSPKTC